MSALSLRLHKSIHAQVRALAEKLSALLTEEYLAARAARGTRRTFLSALDRVPAAAPEPADTPSRAATPKRRVSRHRRGSSKRR